MCKRNILFYSVLALALASASRVGAADGGPSAVSVDGVPVFYATENFPGQNSIAVPAGAVTLTEAAPGELANLSIVFTLSQGTFAATPTVGVNANGGTALAVGAGTLSADKASVSFPITSPSATNGNTVILDALSLAGVGSPLSTTNTAITITAAYLPNAGSLTPFTVGTNPVDAAISTPAGNFAGTAIDGTQTVDVANGGAGQKFRVGNANQLYARLGTVSFSQGLAVGNIQLLGVPKGVPMLIDGTTPLSTGVNDIVGATLTGNTSAFSSVYLSTSDCTATVPSDAVVGTLTANGASFTNIPLDAAVEATSILAFNIPNNQNTYNVCAVANGKNIIPANYSVSSDFNSSFTITPFITFSPRTVSAPNATTYTPVTPAIAYPQNYLAYNGSVGSFDYMVGSVSGYTGLIRAANNDQKDATLYAVAQREDGTLFNNLKLTTSQGVAMPLLKAGTQAFYTAADLQAANGGTAVLTDQYRTATITILSTNTQTTFIDLLSNPGGIVNTIGNNNIITIVQPPSD